MAAVDDDQQTLVTRRRRILAAAGAGITVLAVSGAALVVDPTAGGASTRRDADDAPRSAHIPIDAALVSRAQIEAEQKVHAAIQAQQQLQLAQFYAAMAEYYRPKTGVNWDGIARCETAGNWQMRGSSFSGGLGFYNGTWNSFGGRQFAPNAGMASREQQIVVAERVYARFGLSGWGCRAYG